MFAKKRGLGVLEMVKSLWVYKKLRNFRAGLEANISRLKRAFGLDRCTWQGWPGFRQYVWSAGGVLQCLGVGDVASGAISWTYPGLPERGRGPPEKGENQAQGPGSRPILLS